MHSNNILVTEQFGFRQGIFTENTAFKLTVTVPKSFNQKHLAGEIFCDLAKVFDCVNHETLLAKLQFHGIQGVVAGWFRSSVTDKTGNGIKSSNATQNFFSNWGTIKHGVPLGSVLWPFLL
jgi:hypothetical protein